LTLFKSLFFFCYLSLSAGALDEPYGRTCVCVCVCLQLSGMFSDLPKVLILGAIAAASQGADTGGHRSGLCLRGHHPYRLGVCRVSEVSKCTHTLQTPFTYREPFIIFHIVKGS